MIKENVENMPIPKYSKKQDYLNALTHFIALIVSLFFILSFYILMIKNKEKFIVTDYLAISFYSIALILQFLISTLYHYDTHQDNEKRIKRMLDHLSIFLLIAATYTPLCVLGLKGLTIGRIILIVELSLMVVGIILNVLYMNKLIVRVITFILYIAMGWLIVFIPSAFNALPFNAFMLILFGGITYSLGAILYAIGHIKNQWFHVVFHLFIFAGAMLQAGGIIVLLLAH